MAYDDRGQLLNANLGDYNIPSFEDIPKKLNPERWCTQARKNLRYR
jgi:hypothetical protein